MPTQLFDPARHQAMSAAAWDEAEARRAVQRIVDSARREFDRASQAWPAHPCDDPEPTDQVFTDLYMGAGGVVWALRHLARLGAVEPLADDDGFDALVDALPERNRAALADSLHGSASFLMGDCGLWLLQWQQRRARGLPATALADQIFASVQANVHNPVNEALWGSPGSVLAAIHLAEASAEPRWATLLQQVVQSLLDRLTPDPDTGAPIWTQALYGRPPVRYLGAGHGLAGNVYPALRGAALLRPDLVAAMLEAAQATLQALALHDGPCTNWHPMSDAARVAGRLPLVQDCHGAPGVVCRLAGAPRTAAWDTLLTAAAELTWRAGPVSKGPSLCHGTAGNGFALLKLWCRSGEPLWLSRARAFAMHAIAQVEASRDEHGQGRHSLWTGDLGVACFVWQCVQGSADFPTLDLW